MEIQSIELSNIRSYVGKHKIEFAVSSEQNVTLVHGVNGAGKTSLFIALNWALFGEEFPYLGSIVSSQLMREDLGESCLGSVAIRFSHLGFDYYLTRSMRAERSLAGKILEKQDGLDLYVFDASGQSRLERFPGTFLKSLIPSAIRSFFFFDGDKISDFAKPGRERDLEITRAVNDVLQLELIERSGKHLAALARDIERDVARRGSPRAKELEALRARLESDLASEKARLADLHIEHGAAELQLATLSEKLRDLSVVAEKARRRETLERGFKNARQSVLLAREGLMKACVEFLPTAVLPMLQKTSAQLDQRRRKREIPGNYKDQFLRDMLAMSRCICERSLTVGSEERQHIEALLGLVLPGGAQDQALELSALLKNVINGQAGSLAAMRSLEERLREEQRAADEFENEVREVNLEIARLDVAEVGELEASRGRVNLLLRELGQKIAIVSVSLASLSKQLEDAKRAFDAEVAREAKHEELLNLSGLASESASAFGRIKDRLIADLRVDMSEEATEIFKEFTWKKDYFDQVRVGEDYLIEMLNSGGDDLRAGMSMGETQLLSLAFMLSMIAISEYEAPLVIDTPLARLSRDVRDNLLGALPRLTKQLVLLCTDTEMDSQARSVLGNMVGKEYHLVFLEGRSSILSGAPA